MVADLDQDGRPDVLTASQIDNKVSWFRNRDGLGNFDRPRQILSDAGGAASTGLADLDGDGDLDVLSASYWDNKVAWYENLDAEGHFSTQRVITNIAQRAQAVRWADLDGDLDADVLSASYADNKIAWYENLGAGQLWRAADRQQSRQRSSLCARGRPGRRRRPGRRLGIGHRRHRRLVQEHSTARGPLARSRF